MTVALEGSQVKGRVGVGEKEAAVCQRKSTLAMPSLNVQGVSSLGKKHNTSKQELPDPDVIIIEDDEDGDVLNNPAFTRLEQYDEDLDSDGGSKEVRSSFYKENDSQDVDHFSETASELSDSFDEEECHVIEPGPSRRYWHPQGGVGRTDKRPMFNSYYSEGVRRSESNSSDCEIIEDPYGTIRQSWEAAALRKRVGNALKIGGYRADSEGSTSASNHATNNMAKQSSCRKGKKLSSFQQNEVQEDKHSNNFRTGLATPVASEDAKVPKQKEETPAAFDQQDSNNACSDVRPGGLVNTEDASLSDKTSSTLGEDTISCDEGPSRLHSNSTAVETSSGGTDLDRAVAAEAGLDASQSAGTFVNNDLQQQKMTDDTDVSHSAGTLVDGDLQNPKTTDDTDAVLQKDLLGDRERLKQTEEFRHADEEEWARRQLELQRQAQEVQRLRKRKKAEADRKMEMESRQRQRLEEIRQSQQKEEKNLDYKEQVRGKIRGELERVASNCIDMATLLRRLGIPVDGGVFPTTQQVNAAYKKALLRFHPDRVAGMAKSDPLRQVEAEETFKLILKLKNTLQPVAIRYFS